MKYIISETKLENLICSVAKQPDSYGIILNNFLKSKAPVEEIASGEVDSRSYIEFADKDGGGYIWDNFGNRKKGKSIKIYIEEPK